MGLCVFFIVLLVGIGFQLNGETVENWQVPNPFHQVRERALTRRERFLTGGTGTMFRIGRGAFDIQAHIYEYGVRVRTQFLISDGVSSSREFVINTLQEDLQWGTFEEWGWSRGSIDPMYFFPIQMSMSSGSFRIRRGEERFLWAGFGGDWSTFIELDPIRHATSFGDYEPELEAISQVMVITILRR